jgi:hypothetical protein
VSRTRTQGTAQHYEKDTQAADGGPKPIGHPTYAEVALKLLDNGYEPLPIRPGDKRPAVKDWSSIPIDEERVLSWVEIFGHCGVGLRTGRLVAIDIDLLDPDVAWTVSETVTRSLGSTLVRVGRFPKRVLLYRTTSRFPKHKVGQIEVLAAGQQVVAFGIHPDTGRPYGWPDGDTPLDTRFDDLPLVDEVRIEALLAELAAISGGAPSEGRRGQSTRSSGCSFGNDGRVDDGRDAWLSSIAFHLIHDAIVLGSDIKPEQIANRVWSTFEATTDLSRPRQDGRRPYAFGDSLRKVRDKLRLHQEGRLPERKRPQPKTQPIPVAVPVDLARQQLDSFLTEAVASIEAWHHSDRLSPAPRIGLRATTGLGKSTVARKHIAAMLRRLKDAGLPCRLLNFVPSLALGDETKKAWAILGVDAVVLRGYEASHPLTRQPMCQDVQAVRAAADAGLDIQSSVCFRSQSQRCLHYAGCLKQRNRLDVADADVVIAAYDTMFTGFSGDNQNFAMVLIDEACWQRSYQEVGRLPIEGFAFHGLAGVGVTRRQDACGARMADVVEARQRLTSVLLQHSGGEVTAEQLRAAGLVADYCQAARADEYDILPPARLRPGQSSSDRRTALAASRRRAAGLEVIVLWTVVANLLTGNQGAVGKLWIEDQADGQRAIRILQRKAMGSDLAALPALHLDATLRPELASVALPGLVTVSIDAQAPHQQIRLIAGSFGKSMICPAGHLRAEERQRRENRLREVVDYARWHAKRHVGRRVLVVTYKDVEPAFSGIPGVETAHFNAVAGLDNWGDVACLMLIGRPLPSSNDLHRLSGVLFGQSTTGGYSSALIKVPMRNGTSVLKAIRHPAGAAETVRAAICDDELVQALGRGRGVNRKAEMPLEVHILGDVVLPILHDSVAPWESVCPDVFQRMLLAGVAVDSPADAVALHPELFGTSEQARKAFDRAAFSGQNPIGNSYREMSVKSAAYRRVGRGRSWQRAWWIDGDAMQVRERLQRTLGGLGGWETCR